LQKDPSGLCAFCWRDGSVGHLVAGIPGINIAGVGENPRRRGGFRTAGKSVGPEVPPDIEDYQSGGS
ncbi:mCG1026367, isoform CRA_a, partial [Mus musculus]